MKGITVVAFLAVSCWLAVGDIADADWMWTPESGKWISEKNIEKKSAMLLYEQAQTLEQSGDMSKAIATYRKLIKQYPASSVAPDAQYWIGHLLEEQGDYYKAFKEYHKVIENYPSYKKFNEILEREYQIGNLYLSGEKLKLLGVSLLPAVDKSIEIFESIVRTAPYSAIAPRAQFNIGEAYRKIKRYAEAIPEYQKVVDNYPESDLVGEARYQIGQCSYKKTLNASFDQTNTDIALESMQTFLRKDKDSKKTVEMKQRIEELTARKAKKAYDIAEFYNASHADEAAIIYYQEVINSFPQTEFAKLAAQKIDHIVAHPSRKKTVMATEEDSSQTGTKKGMLARLWPFGKKADQAKVADSESTTATTLPVVIEEDGKKPGFFTGLWPFGKKQKPVPAVMGGTAPARAKKKAASKKPFWAFWVKEDKQATLSGTDDEYTAAAAAAKMKLPAHGGSRHIARHIRQGDLADPSVAKPATEDSALPEAARSTQQAAIPAAQKRRPIPAELLIRSFQVEQEGEKIRMMFETNGDLSFKTFYLKEPARILISFPRGVYSGVAENILVNQAGVLSIRQHFRSNEEQPGLGRPVNAMVLDLQKDKQAKVYNDLDTFIIEIEKS